jgi:hypothetical protein
MEEEVETPETDAAEEGPVVDGREEAEGVAEELKDREDEIEEGSEA